MTRIERLRRVGILCCHCLRNLAFYKAGWHEGAPKRKEQFWVNANGNFLDIAVLEWCKLFADSRGKHFWQKVISDHDLFRTGLLKELGVDGLQFDDYASQMRTYRDKFIAHLDSEDIMHIPRLQIAITSSAYLLDYLVAHEEEDNCFHEAPKNAAAFYARFQNEGAAVYESVKT